MRTSLYRHFDAAGLLLYVGISLNPVARLIQHRSADWFDKIARIEIEWHASRSAAEQAERSAIKDERPAYNLAHTGQEKIERAYLKAADRARELLDALPPDDAERAQALIKDLFEIKGALTDPHALRQWFPAWREKTDEQRTAFRKEKPFPEK